MFSYQSYRLPEYTNGYLCHIAVCRKEIHYPQCSTKSFISPEITFALKAVYNIPGML